MKRNTITNIVVLISLIFFTPSCEKTLDLAPPVTDANRDMAYSGNATAAAVLSGIYTKMMDASTNNYAGGTNSIAMLMGMYADELTNYYTSGTAIQQYYINAVPETSTAFWDQAYKLIYSANDAIDGITNSAAITDPVRSYLLGEAKFIRAFNYFYLVNLFGDAPIILSRDYTVNMKIPSSSVADVYKQIITDLKDAQLLLSDNYMNARLNAVSVDRVRPVKAAATALLAKALLFTKDYENAEIEASKIINNTANYALLPTADINKVFLKNSKEAIWQLMPVHTSYNTWDANYFILKSAPGTREKPAALTTGLIAAFEAGDQRLANWVGSYTAQSATYRFPHKYKEVGQVANVPVTEYAMVLRVAEQYLIRAEARAALGRITGANSAAEDVNAIRNRAGLGITNATTSAQMQIAIEQERRIELFSEWGHRWIDIKRFPGINNPSVTRADEIMPAVSLSKGGTWEPFRKLLPKPLTTVRVAPVDQNFGYTN